MKISSHILISMQFEVIRKDLTNSNGIQYLNKKKKNYKTVKIFKMHL